MRKGPGTTVAAIAAMVLIGPGCDKKEDKTATDTTPAAAPSVEEAKLAVPSPVEEPEEQPKAEQRPEKIDTELTAERRAAVEKALPDAKGFLVAAELEEGLKSNKAADKEAVALSTFDRKARGKWVLFTGPMVNLTEDGFDLGITYTPQMPNDPMGMSRQWFPVTFTGIEGYDESKFKAGNVVVVLARYDGKKQASSGHELVEAGHW